MCGLVCFTSWKIWPLASLLLRSYCVSSLELYCMWCMSTYVFTVMCADVTHLDFFPSESFDVIISKGSFENTIQYEHSISNRTTTHNAARILHLSTLFFFAFYEQWSTLDKMSSTSPNVAAINTTALSFVPSASPQLLSFHFSGLSCQINRKQQQSLKVNWVLWCLCVGCLDAVMTGVMCIDSAKRMVDEMYRLLAKDGWYFETTCKLISY